MESEESERRFHKVVKFYASDYDFNSVASENLPSKMFANFWMNPDT